MKVALRIPLIMMFVLVAIPGFSQLISTGYLYYAGGGVPDAGDANPVLDGTPTGAGDNGVFSVLVADVDFDAGTVTNWRYATGSLNKLSGHDDPGGYSWMFLENAVHAYNGFLYVGPGDWNADSSRQTADLVAWAPINPDGSLGAWSYSDPIISDTDEQAICATAIVSYGTANPYYYVLGGTLSGLDRVAFAQINPDGSLGSWSTTTALPSIDWFNRAVAVQNIIIHATGHMNTGSDRHIHYNTANFTDGTLSPWQDGGVYDSTSGNRWDYGMCSAIVIEIPGPSMHEFVIIMGGNTGSGVVDTVHVSEVTGGVPGTWSTTNVYPGGPQRHITATSALDFIMAMGGTTGANPSTATDDVYLGRIDSGGTITWSTSPVPMNQSRGFGGAAFYLTDIPVETEAQNWYIYE